MTYEKLFEQFLRHREYVDNYSHHTILTYKLAWKYWVSLLETADITTQLCFEYMIRMREHGITPVSCNTHAKAMNGFFKWLAECEYTPTEFHIKHMKVEARVIQAFSDDHLKRIIQFKPKGFQDSRLHAMLLLMIDTGARINEVTSLKRDDVNLDALIVRVMGKGKKERYMPVSVELRKVLWKFLAKHDSDLVFPTRNGTKCSNRNVWRDFKILGEKLGVTGVRISPHTLRHTFARNYLKQGGNLFYLSKTMGHANINVTKKYIEVETEDLQIAHLKTSILSRLR